MATANRVINILYFLSRFSETDEYTIDFQNKIVSLLKRHGDFLYSDENYTEHNNHEIYQIQALLELSLIFPNMVENQKWFKKEIERLKERLKPDFTNDGVHKEHSPGYAVGMLKLLENIQFFWNKTAK